MITAERHNQTTADTQRDAGVVKWFSVKKGFGFIESASGEDIFVHYSSIKGRGYRTLEPGDRVTFEKVPGPKGHQAYSVQIVT